MIKDYKHLTYELRVRIAYKFNDEGKWPAQIGRELLLSAETVSRELKRNKTVIKAYKVRAEHKLNGKPITVIDKIYFYCPKRAQELADKRVHRVRCQHKISPGTVLFNKIDTMFQELRKPDVIAGRLKLEHPNEPEYQISHEAIYAYAYKHLECGWWNCLTKARKKRKKQAERKRPPRDRASIDNRPATANNRQEIEHLEGDSIVGKRGETKTVINTAVDRKARMMFAVLVPDKTAENTATAVKSSLSDVIHIIKSLTVDNGTEFAKHKKIAEKLDIDVYFADPYSSWQRGTNERHNGLIRRFFPKKYDFSHITHEDLQEVVDFWNNYPRKILGYKTPLEVWNEETEKLGLAA